jgi:AcrR family transcriptional regulator
MSQLSAAAKARPSRSRRGSRPSGDDRELAILATAERLLADRPLSDISIDELAKGAGISRPTFYFYFSSKEAVLLSLLDGVVAEADEAAFGNMELPTGDPTELWRAGINAFFTIFGEHRAVAAAAAQAGGSEVSELWARMMAKWVRHTELIIEAERERGAAPPGLSAHDLAVTLNLMNARVMGAAFAGEQPSVAESKVVDTLLHVWLNSIYLTPPDLRCPADKD